MDIANILINLFSIMEPTSSPAMARAKLNAFSINVQRYSQNNAQNCIFEPPYGASGAM